MTGDKTEAQARAVMAESQRDNRERQRQTEVLSPDPGVLLRAVGTTVTQEFLFLGGDVTINNSERT